MCRAYSPDFVLHGVPHACGLGCYVVGPAALMRCVFVEWVE